MSNARLVSSNDRVEVKNSLPFTYDEWERLAREKMDFAPYSYLKGSGGIGRTYSANLEAFNNWKLSPRVLRNVENRDLSVELFNQTYKTPFLLAPIGVQSILHEEGELASARAAKEMGIPFIASTLTSFSLEEIANVMGDAPRWFQLYWIKDDEVTISLLKRAEKSGYNAIVLTVDQITMGWRVQDLENGYSPFKQGIGLANFLADPVFCSKLVGDPLEDRKEALDYFLSILINPTLTWDNIAFLRKHTKLPIIIKGILNPLDAKLALENGADGIIVSNHGGRQIDGAIAAIDALPQICDVVEGNIPVLMDSGIRTGADVIKAFALGATAVLVGRPFAYGLAVAGEDGVKQVIKNLIADTDITLALSGYESIANLDRYLLVR